VQRGLSPREMLHSSEIREYIGHLLQHENRSVWIAQEKEGPKMVMILPIQVF
jgi:hypothetical protein